MHFCLMYEKIINIQCLLTKIIGDFEPSVGVVLGSGLGGFVDHVKILHSVPYSEIKGMPISTVQGHDGRFVFGLVGSVKVVVMQGRFHYYEGYSLEEIVLPIRVMSLLGVKTLLLSNAAGGVNSSLSVGDIMIINDHINFIPNPLIGPNIKQLGVRFPALTDIYSGRVAKIAKEAASKTQLNLKSGIYVALTGPSYETQAEIRFLRLIGGDAVGMSTVPEVIAACHAGMEVFAVSIITNVHSSVGIPTHEEVVEQGALASVNMNNLFNYIIQNV